MIEIRPLTKFDSVRFREFSAGYTSTTKYQVTKSENDMQTTISLNLVELQSPFVKKWESTREQETNYSRVIEQGLSLGVYDEDRLVGIAIAEKQEWNRTLWVWEFHIDVEYRQRGLGRQLMDRLEKIGKENGCRVMVCETQNTNVPAIRFYRSVGFEVGAVDLSYYSNSDILDFEVAVFMKRFIE
ncbi:GNAT family N-acetyltransferase [Candidatus Thorarchaeota archaeon]|nr:GNAT family N-acetyltransferase [Candidatus Thorarchaeota archaeon]TFG95382.1 MAG: GNAT family N-acetyltransferase [Candidatus Thorarchaeota archaeon]